MPHRPLIRDDLCGFSNFCSEFLNSEFACELDSERALRHSFASVYISTTVLCYCVLGRKVTVIASLCSSIITFSIPYPMSYEDDMEFGETFSATF